MTTETQTLLDRVLALSEEHRRIFVEALLESLDEPPGAIDLDNDPEWAAELKRRVDDVRAGRAVLVPWEEVRADALRRILEHSREV